MDVADHLFLFGAVIMLCGTILAASYQISHMSGEYLLILLGFGVVFMIAGMIAKSFVRKKP